ncbi:MAG: alpha/beta fold hydrolase [Actinomycetota bacterium]|nr:alpha/beta fold hydrolase [Actinomycetota bacterium]MEE3257136.1 alpha/beta fold hydrolase [Actinomycetota bacterium]
MSASYEEIEFQSAAATLRGRLYRAPKPDAPLVVLAHGFSATAHMSINAYAQGIADAGYNVVAYDHRNFGTSDGEPRFGFDQWIQVRGYSDAITHTLALAGVETEQVVVWGESMGGATVQYVAAFDPRVTAVIAHTPGCGENYVEPAADLSDFHALKTYSTDGDLTEEPAAEIPVRFADLPTSEAPVMLNFEAALEYAKAYGQRAGSLWSNDVTIVVRKAPELSVPVVAAQLSVPTLYVVASDDEVAGASPAVAEQCFNTITGPKAWEDIEGGHFGLLHEDSHLFQQALDADLSFLAEHI